MNPCRPLQTLAACLLLTAGAPALAHVPYLERDDYSETEPFEVRGSIEQSIAVYSWIDTGGAGPATDVDAYAFSISEPTSVYVEAIVPVCPGYEDFRPSFALVGPGLPTAPADLPFTVPNGYGAVVVDDPGEVPRETYFEPFGGKSYYQGPVLSRAVSTAGEYTVYYWDPQQSGGDYVAVLGDQEIWGLRDIIRALIVTPLIRRDRELHVPCDQP
jgi:hypothetical protein